MDTAEEDASDDDPEQNREPAKGCSLDRAVDGACAGDGGEMVTHKNRCFCRNIVDTVLQLVCWCFARRIDPPLFCEPSAVADVTDEERYDRNDQY